VRNLFGWQRMNWWSIFLSKLIFLTKWSLADDSGDSLVKITI
jgi:hypothetical protein